MILSYFLFCVSTSLAQVSSRFFSRVLFFFSFTFATFGIRCFPAAVDAMFDQNYHQNKLRNTNWYKYNLKARLQCLENVLVSCWRGSHDTSHSSFRPRPPVILWGSNSVTMTTAIARNHRQQKSKQNSVSGVLWSEIIINFVF